jgi:hypothetical protein
MGRSKRGVNERYRIIVSLRKIIHCHFLWESSSLQVDQFLITRGECNLVCLATVMRVSRSKGIHCVRPFCVKCITYV